MEVDSTAAGKEKKEGELTDETPIGNSKWAVMKTFAMKEDYKS